MSVSDVSDSQDLERNIRSLVARVVSGEATSEEKARLQALLEMRSRKLRTPMTDQLKKLKGIRTG